MSLSPEILAAHDAAVAAGKPSYPDPRTGLLVMTRETLLARGACCGSGCRHCPWWPADKPRPGRR